MEDYDDDPIINEIDIFNCSGIGNQSFLLQFPLVSRNSDVPSVQYGRLDPTTDNYQFIVLPPQDIMTSSDKGIHIESTTKVNMTQPLAMAVLTNNQLHLTPIYQTLQSRPVPGQNGIESKDVDISFCILEQLDQFISSSTDDISAPMSSQMFQKKLTDTETDMNVELLENLDDSALQSRPPREQLVLKLIRDKTIHFDDTLSLLDLKAHTEELLSVLVEHAYFIQGRWTIKPEEIPEKTLPRELRIARNFMIVLFANKKPLTNSMFEHFLNLFNVKREHMVKILEGLGIRMKGGQIISFKFKENPQFENKYKEYADRGRSDINQLKEMICIAKHDDHLFDPFFESA
ncbi:hypothetical protein TRFO_38567 [Tritrichomonas foetus]|uniref:Uncharacterized protein n=1 Tax=Tritrichomonas foetus TaxID=1144522 RepID=A0A1J4JDK4_9EUKA|nr:hypothetical protein TRFO_38567 [Tritrichomonas foetus]|eukprot:OHS95332.1 hypothetical protein TRFO_38567 [Tritrichomonas foetus]